MYISKVSGALQIKVLNPPLHSGVVIIEKGAFGSASTTVGQLTYACVCARACVCLCV